MDWLTIFWPLRRDAALPSERISTAWRNDTPSVFITQSTTLPPTWQAPRQCHRPFEGVMTKDGVLSAWNGQRPMRSFVPWGLSSTPLARTKAARSISLLMRSSSICGIRAMPVSFLNTPSRGKMRFLPSQDIIPIVLLVKAC